MSTIPFVIGNISVQTKMSPMIRRTMKAGTTLRFSPPLFEDVEMDILIEDIVDPSIPANIPVAIIPALMMRVNDGEAVKLEKSMTKVIFPQDAEKIEFFLLSNLLAGTEVFRGESGDFQRAGGLLLTRVSSLASTFSDYNANGPFVGYARFTISPPEGNLVLPDFGTKSYTLKLSSLLKGVRSFCSPSASITAPLSTLVNVATRLDWQFLNGRTLEERNILGQSKEPTRRVSLLDAAYAPAENGNYIAAMASLPSWVREPNSVPAAIITANPNSVMVGLSRTGSKAGLEYVYGDPYNTANHFFTRNFDVDQVTRTTLTRTFTAASFWSIIETLGRNKGIITSDENGDPFWTSGATFKAEEIFVIKIEDLPDMVALTKGMAKSSVDFIDSYMVKLIMTITMPVYAPPAVPDFMNIEVRKNILEVTPDGVTVERISYPNLIVTGKFEAGMVNLEIDVISDLGWDIFNKFSDTNYLPKNGGSNWSHTLSYHQATTDGTGPVLAEGRIKAYRTENNVRVLETAYAPPHQFLTGFTAGEFYYDYNSIVKEGDNYYVKIWANREDFTGSHLIMLSLDGLGTKFAYRRSGLVSLESNYLQLWVPDELVMNGFVLYAAVISPEGVESTTNNFNPLKFTFA